MNEEKNIAPTAENGGSNNEKTKKCPCGRLKEALGGKSKVKNDIIFIAILVIFASLAGAFLLIVRKDGAAVSVTVGGEVYAEYSLSEDREVAIAIGDNLNYLVIKDGMAYMKEASCPDGICVSHKAVSKVGESIVCLPNKVAVTVIGKTSDSTDINVG